MKTEFQLKQKRYRLLKELKELRQRKISANTPESLIAYNLWEKNLEGQVKSINWTLKE